MSMMDEEFEKWAPLNKFDVEDRTARRIFLAGASRGIEAAAKAICKSCADGIDKPGRCRNHWHHYAESPAADAEEGDMCIVSDCAAWKIRNLLPGEGER